jgi:hypothetical protein
MHNTTFCSSEPDSAKLYGLVSETGWSEISRNSDDSSETMIDPDDWRTPLVHYLENPDHIANMTVR